MLSVSGMAGNNQTFPANVPVVLPSVLTCCSKGGFPTHRHNEIRDFTASVLTEVCHDVCTEPPLQELVGEPLPYATSNREDGAQLDIRSAGRSHGYYNLHTLLMRYIVSKLHLRHLPYYV